MLIGQQDEKWIDGNGHNSIFQSLISGEFLGTINGILIVQNSEGKPVLLDFQGSKSKLSIIEDPGQVYDISTKSYIGQTTSGRTKIMYETYATANKIGIQLQGEWYELSAIDGGCDMVINGLDYTYNLDQESEYLSIYITKEIELSNWQYILRNRSSQSIEELKLLAKSIYIKPKSSIVFAIRKTHGN